MPMHITKTEVLVEMNCGECGMDFAMPEWFNNRCREQGTCWSCPAGHHRVYRKSDLTKAQEDLAAERERSREIEIQKRQVEDQLGAAEREAKRLAKRVVNGVCPCCNRSFVQLTRHMKSQHPEFAKDGA